MLATVNKHINNPSSKHVVLEIVKTFELTYIIRFCHLEDQRLSWRRNIPFKQAGSDYFLIFYAMTDHVKLVSLKIVT